MMEKNLIIFTSKSKSENFQVKEKLLENRNIRCRGKVDIQKREKQFFFAYQIVGFWDGAGLEPKLNQYLD